MLTAAIVGTAGGQGTSEPREHFTIETPARLDDEDARSIYEAVADQMARGYAASNDPTAAAYRGWRRHNTAPYVSKTHGNRYVNNYANKVAKNYGRLEPGEALPVGSIIAKDSLTVTDKSDVFVGALFIMEKLPVGKSPDTGNWRYIMIMPDGSLFGDSQGEDADNVGFCHGCHASVAKNDYLFGVPKAVKRAFAD